MLINKVIVFLFLFQEHFQIPGTMKTHLSIYCFREGMNSEQKTDFIPEKRNMFLNYSNLQYLRLKRIFPAIFPLFAIKKKKKERRFLKAKHAIPAAITAVLKTTSLIGKKSLFFFALSLFALIGQIISLNLRNCLNPSSPTCMKQGCYLFFSTVSLYGHRNLHDF